MDDDMFNFRSLQSVRMLIVSAEEEVNTLKSLYSVYQIRLNSLNSSRRKLLFSGNELETISEVVTLVYNIESMRKDIEASRIHLSTLLSSALSYLVVIIENNQDMKSSSMPRLRNEIRNITKLVIETKGMNVDYSSLATLAIRAICLVTTKEKSPSTEMTRRLLVVLKNTII